ncbi:MAG: ribonuclease P protein component [Anaerolineales bacterium]|uniref:ribonuclease P protein component n=1 Tax=Candidatus Villigracilis vicinus TaxID=3140679 RepID=UPI003135857F|nr:ribonuclease P protein component [Anaerolineales bacterium]MBK7447927.1 ribonuclease P protein component [Anaerolineales bacterium]MBK9779299.1 ribonuclease P protein component [Anaerolineales bacterium]
MHRQFRLSRSEDFKRVRRTGKSYAHPLVVLVTQASEMKDHLKIGVTAGKTTGTAVHRNRAKRLLREAMRTLIPSIASGWDLILIARPALVTATLEDTRSALINVLTRARLFSADESSG